MLTVLLFSLIGIPLTAGFTGKLMIFFRGHGPCRANSAWLYRAPGPRWHDQTRPSAAGTTCALSR